MDKTKGIVFNIERHSLHDGPGIRTIVFLAGCPLSCRWCANPEGLLKKSLFVDRKRCTGCGACEIICHLHAVKIFDGKCVTDRKVCDLCGKCIDVCPEGIRSIQGQEMSVAEVIENVLRDEVFFRQSGGGLTLSGGEPFAQKDFAKAILKEARANGINTAVETCGFVPYESIEEALPYVNTFLFDVKHTDPEKHKEYTGHRNELIQENLHNLGKAGANITVRVPLIPGFNDSKEELAEIAKIASEVKAFRMDVLPFHKLAMSKHDQLETIYSMEKEDVIETQKVEEIVLYAKQFYGNIHIEI